MYGNIATQMFCAAFKLHNQDRGQADECHPIVEKRIEKIFNKMKAIHESKERSDQQITQMKECFYLLIEKEFSIQIEKISQEDNPQTDEPFSFTSITSEGQMDKLTKIFESELSPEKQENLAVMLLKQNDLGKWESAIKSFLRKYLLCIFTKYFMNSYLGDEMTEEEFLAILNIADIRFKPGMENKYNNLINQLKEALAPFDDDVRNLTSSLQTASLNQPTSFIARLGEKTSSSVQPGQKDEMKDQSLGI